MTAEPVEWRVDAANSRLLRGVLYGWIGLFGGAMALVGALAVGGAIVSALAGEVGPFVWVAVLVLLGGPVSVLYVWPALRPEWRPSFSLFVPDPVDDPEESVAERYAEAFSWRGVVASVLIGAGVIAALAGLDARALAAYVAFWFVLLVLASGFITWGRVDPTEPRLEYRTTTVPLEAVGTVRRLRLGDVVVYWLSYRSGARDFSTPTWLTVTVEAAGAVDRALERAEPIENETSPPNRAVTVVAVAIGLATLAAAGGIWTVDGLETGLAAYLSLMLGGFGLFVCWAGIRLA